jgi:hypothetical protein
MIARRRLTPRVLRRTTLSSPSAEKGVIVCKKQAALLFAKACGDGKRYAVGEAPLIGLTYLLSIMQVIHKNVDHLDHLDHQNKLTYCK